MDVAIFELLSNSSSCFRWASTLKLDDFYKVRNTTNVILLITFTGEIFDSNGDCGIGFLLVNEF